MRVIAPQTKELEPVVTALNASGYKWEAKDVSGSDSAYFDLISDLWESGETFATVEHDIVINPDTLLGFNACQSDWCVALYPYAVTGHYCGLGCCKISGKLIARNKDAMKVTATWADDGHPAKHWCRVDGWLRAYLENRGEQFHVHYPPLVGHIGNTWPSHGCVLPPEGK